MPSRSSGSPPPVLDVHSALKPGAPQVHPELASYSWMKGVFFPEPGRNTAHHQKIRKGDVDKGFAEADKVFEFEFQNPPVQHVPMETHTAIAQALPGGDVEIIVLGAVAVHRPPALLPLLRDAAAQGARARPVRGRRLRRQGRHPPRAARLLPLEGGRRSPRQDRRHARGGVQHAAVAPGAALEDQDRRDQGRPDHGARDRVPLGRRRVRRLRRQHRTRGGLRRCRALRRSPTASSTRTSSTPTRSSAPRIAASATSRCSGAIERNMDLVARGLRHRPAPRCAGKTCSRSASTTITGELFGESHGRPDECLRLVAEEIGWKRRAGQQARHAPARARCAARGSRCCTRRPRCRPTRRARRPSSSRPTARPRCSSRGVDYGQGTYTALTQIAADELRLPVEKVRIPWDSRHRLHALRLADGRQPLLGDGRQRRHRGREGLPASDQATSPARCCTPTRR